MVKTSRNRNSVKIILDFTGVSRLSGNNSVIPFLTAAEKRRFCPPKLPALRAEVDGLAQKSASPFSCSPLAASPSAEICSQTSFFCSWRSCNTPARWRNVRSSSFRRVHARLCPESRTSRRHGRDRLGLALWLCDQPVFSMKSAYFFLAASSSSLCICLS